VYQSNGSVAPRAEREPDFDPTELSLLPVQVDTWGPFMFVNPDADAPSLRETLGRLPELLAEVVDVDGLTFHHRSTSAVSSRPTWASSSSSSAIQLSSTSAPKK
jgi:phenylpropionate dioxygenase-like ring-hydroxylating dioxygenase large terminal subunit